VIYPCVDHCRPAVCKVECIGIRIPDEYSGVIRVFAEELSRDHVFLPVVTCSTQDLDVLSLEEPATVG
jgi:hypothetical protein